MGRLAVWADRSGLPREPDVWLRTETIDAFVLSGCVGMDGSTVQTLRARARRVREALVWVQRGEAPPVRLSSPRDPHPPYESGELARLRSWAGNLPGQARLDGLALMALGAGCGLMPVEVIRVRGSHIRLTRSKVAVLDEELLEAAGSSYLFRPGRKVEAAKNLVNSWPARHRPHVGLPPLSARRLRSTWIVGLLANGISEAVVAQAAGMASLAALAPYHRWVPPLPQEEVIRLLHGHRR
ncbi:hypothetical protein [Streptomyces decoyicus]|uniref:hypothetical protein n=1 Tax=Streptomyces decoyicus TaxID=249567 RepID=UPI00382F2F27